MAELTSELRLIRPMNLNSQTVFSGHGNWSKPGKCQMRTQVQAVARELLLARPLWLLMENLIPSSDAKIKTEM